MTAVVVGLVLFSAGDPDQRRALSEPPVPRTGTLVFAADAGGETGRQRLWKLDLVTGGCGGVPGSPPPRSFSPPRIPESDGWDSCP